MGRRSIGRRWQRRRRLSRLAALLVLVGVGAVMLAFAGPAAGQAQSGSEAASPRVPVAIKACLLICKLTVTPPTTGQITGPGILCSKVDNGCSETFQVPTTVTLRGVAVGNSWSFTGCNSQAGPFFADNGEPYYTCTVQVVGLRTVSATLTELDYTLTVTVTGSGQGNVSGYGISCGTDGSDCTDTEQQQTSMFSLHATAEDGSVFSGWTGCPTPNGPDCQYQLLKENLAITATFTRRYDLTVNKAGTGSGTVSSDPSGILCGGDCEETYDAGTKVALQATSAADSTFTGWSGACSGTGACVVTLDAAKTVTATFDLVPQGGGTGAGGTGGGGSGGSGGTGGSDQQVDAALLAIKTTKTLLGARVVKVELEAHETVSVELTLTRGRSTLVHRHVASFSSQDGIVTITIPSRAKKGKATLTIVLTDTAGNTETLTKPVTIPAKPKPKHG